jgi:hypothetical protein
LSGDGLSLELSQREQLAGGAKHSWLACLTLNEELSQAAPDMVHKNLSGFEN